MPDDLEQAIALREVHCELHAGSDYADQLIDVLIAVGFSASWPVRGLTQGELMHFYTVRQRSWSG